MTTEEANQIAEMYNWAEKEKDITVFEVAQVTASDMTDSHYTIECTMWINNKFFFCTSVGFTLMDAMKQFSAKWADNAFTDYKHFDRSKNEQA
jgi:hypothetical protein